MKNKKEMKQELQHRIDAIELIMKNFDFELDYISDFDEDYASESLKPYYDELNNTKKRIYTKGKIELIERLSELYKERLELEEDEE